MPQPPRSSPVQRLRRPTSGLDGLVNLGVQFLGRKAVLDALDLVLNDAAAGGVLDAVAKAIYDDTHDEEGATRWEKLQNADKKIWRNRAFKAISALRAVFYRGKAE